MTVDGWNITKTKLAILVTLLSVLVSIVTYTATVTMLYASVQSDLRNLNTLLIEKQAASEREHEVFRFDIRELRQALANRREPVDRP